MFPTTCTLQVFIDGVWCDAAALDLTGELAHGVAASSYLIYLPGYALRYWQRSDAAALSVNIPVELTSYSAPTWPPFAVDLLPQGDGRVELLKQLARDETAGPGADWALLCAGAGNPIGNIRVKEAHAWITARSGNVAHGFTMDEVAARAGDLILRRCGFIQMASQGAFDGTPMMAVRPTGPALSSKPARPPRWTRPR